MNETRLSDYLDYMREAAFDACCFVDGQSKEEFLADRRTQRAVVMSLVIIGEAATKVMEHFPEFANQHTDVPWRGMRGLGNRIAHGYFDLNLDVVWETVRTALPELDKQLAAVRSNADQAGLETTAE